MKSETTIDTLHLFPILDEHLHALLLSLSDEDWNKQTLAPKWKVKDVAAHLLDGSIRGISVMRDHYFREKAPADMSYRGLVNFLDKLNADWVEAMNRVSQPMLIELLQITGQSYNAMLKELDPFADAIFSVGWAGEERSMNWFHIAREYTEKWHHQQQIRWAVGQEEVLYSRDLYHPYLETSMQALPHHYKTVNAREGSVISVKVEVEGGAEWLLKRTPGGWELISEFETQPVCSVTIPKEIAWRIFSKEVSMDEALRRVTIKGEKLWGEHFLKMVAVMA